MTIGTKVMKMNEYKGSSISYKVACSCGSDDCNCGIDFEIDKDFGVIVNFYKIIKWADYFKYNWFFMRWWARIKVALKVLFTGEIKLEGDFFVQGQDHIESIIEIFKEGQQKMLQWEEEFQKVK